MQNCLVDFVYKHLIGRLAMRILLFGGNGLLGREFQRNLISLGEVYAPSRQDVDFSDFQKLTNLITHLKPHIIINAAAYTDVDQAEKEPELAMRVNGIALGVISEAANKVRASLLHFSSDYVFDGSKKSPYAERDLPNPINVYGQTKLAGEKIIHEMGDAYIILRTSWLYSMERNNFVTNLLSWARQKDVIRVVVDQTGSPTWTRWLAQTTCNLLNNAGDEPYDFIKQKKGVYHLAGKGSVSRYDWARFILASEPHREQHMYTSLQPASSDEFKGLASRPSYSVLDSSLFENEFNLVVLSWERYLKAC
jgi:dTDP-4-dehydrorhamnose reductase